MPLKRKIRLFLSGMAATKRLVLIFLTTTGLASVANAQGLPTAEKPSCFTDFWTYNNSSIKDCPLSYAGITLYGNIDGGYGWENHGVPLSASASKVNYAIQRNSNRSTWLWSPNAASTSTVGVKIEETISGKWLFIGVAETGFNPYSMRLINGPQSLVDNNLNTLQFQTSHFDLSRAGQWDNGQGFVGISNPEYGTLTFGRTTTLSSTAISKYDPVASTAFSQIGFSATYATFGASPTAHSNTAVTYRLDYPGPPPRLAGADRRLRPRQCVDRNVPVPSRRRLRQSLLRRHLRLFHQFRVLGHFWRWRPAGRIRSGFDPEGDRAQQPGRRTAGPV